MSRLIRWRRVRIAAWVALGGLLLAHPVAQAASDVFGNVGPGSSTSGLADRFPLGNYALDHHFDAVNASLTGGIDVSGVPPLIAYFLADVIWQLTAFISNTVITLFAFAFSLDLVNGSQATGGAGALAPVSQAVRSIYSSVFGAPWMVLAVTAAGLWAMWKALVQRRYAETAGALALSLLFTVMALAFVTQPERTIGQASRWTNQLSAAFLSLSNSGTISDESQARQQASDQLYTLLVYQPWAVLNFGGLEHCVRTPVKDPPESVAVRPLSTSPGRDAQLSGQLRDGTQVTADGKACVNDANKYASHFLGYPPESDDRNAEYDALKDGDTGKLPDSDPAKKAGGNYSLSGVDKPAADAMGKGGQYQRLLLAIVVLIGELGAWLLLGALSIGVILAQVLVLLLLAFAPVALVAGIYPGRGHDLFRGWLSRLATFLVRKAIYSLILAVLLAVVAALQDATSNLGWLLSFGLQALFLWAVFLYRHQLTAAATSATTGSESSRTQRLSLPSLYWASRLSRALPGGSSRPRSGQPTRPPPAPTSTGAQPASTAAPDEAPAAVAPADQSPPDQPPDHAQIATSGESAANDAPSAGPAAHLQPLGERPSDGGPTATAPAAAQRPSSASPGAADTRPPTGPIPPSDRARPGAGASPPTDLPTPRPPAATPQDPHGQTAAAGAEAPQNRTAPPGPRPDAQTPASGSLLEQLRADRERLGAGADPGGEKPEPDGPATEIRPPQRPSPSRRQTGGSE